MPKFGTICRSGALTLLHHGGDWFRPRVLTQEKRAEVPTVLVNQVGKQQ